MLNVFPWSNFNEVLFYILAMNCIKLVSGYLYFSSITFPKIWKYLGGQLEIRLSV